MKLQENTNTIERSGQFEQSNYTIEATAKAFSILSDGLYSNKIRAVVRELSTNAYDSHVAAGCPELPFDVQLPSVMEPTFYIRDYGTGLSHEDCMSLYTTYFRSNKTDTNQAVGCLGLGSKSPFAYNDSFLVESFFNGMHRTYTAYKNENEEPVFALLSEKETEEPNGLKVSLPARDDDYYEFISEAEQIYESFAVRPNVTGADITIKEVEYTLTGDFWGIRKGYHDAVAVMGQIAYPIDVDVFDDYENSNIKSLLNSPIVINFDIGELNMTPSREQLSYNKYTKDAIVRKAERILNEMKEILADSFEDCRDIWSARMHYCSLQDYGHILNKITGVFDRDLIEWQGQKLWDDFSMGVQVTTTMPIKHYWQDSWKSSVSCEHVQNITFAGNDFILVVDDLKRGGVGRTRAYIRDICGDKWSNNKKLRAYLIKGTEEELQQFYSQLGMTEDAIAEFVKYTSDFPAVSSNRSGYSGEARSKACEFIGHKESYGNWTDTEINFKDGGIYVEINRYKYKCPSGYFKDSSNLNRKIKTLEGLGMEFNEPLYGIKSAALKQKGFRESEWTDFNKLYEDAILYFARGLEKAYIWSKCREEVFYKYDVMRKSEVIKLIEECDVYTDFSKLVELHGEDPSEEDVCKLDHLANGLRHIPRDKRPESFENDNLANPMKELEDSIYEKYPMLKLYVDEKGWNEIEDNEIKAIARYIELVETQKVSV